MANRKCKKKAPAKKAKRTTAEKSKKPAKACKRKKASLPKSRTPKKRNTIVKKVKKIVKRAKNQLKGIM